MNKELDIDNLKRDWKEQDSIQNRYSQAELVLMLNKKSGNNVKYIVIISIIEFVILMLSLLFTATNKNGIIQNLDIDAGEVYIRNYKISQVLVYVNIVISLGFIFYFYKCYKRINLLSSIKELINNILRIRKSVNRFISINVTLGLLTLFLTGFYDFMFEFKEEINSTSQDIITIEKIHHPFSSPEYVFLFIIICLLTILMIAAYYSLIYGILLRRLKKNLQELQKLESEG
ncbi:MAG: hypothetical protein LBQ84_01665 [Flavobacteriaceae bacterium]|jgi:hypothetical protein|nr:hypothetical protein [Flavobacteriaceae bacterium]